MKKENLVNLSPELTMLSGEPGPAPFFIGSNESWTDDTLSRLAGISGENAVVVGSGNVPNVIPLINGIKNVQFADRHRGHAGVLMMKAAILGGHLPGYEPNVVGLADALGAKSPDPFEFEAHMFDISRVEPLHVFTNQHSAERFVETLVGVRCMDVQLDVMTTGSAKSVSDLGRTAWVHLSNMPSFAVFEGYREMAKRLNRTLTYDEHLAISCAARGIIYTFASSLPGVDDETVITVCERESYTEPSQEEVKAIRKGDITLEDILSLEEATAVMERVSLLPIG